MADPGLVFTRAWEDDRLDLEALAIQAGDRVLVVAGAGDVALAAASEGAGEVVAVDSNPAQLHLVALKIAASRTLDHQTRFRLFEVGRHPSAESIYRSELRPNLEPGAVAFWDEHIRRFETGIHTAQGVGRAFARLGRLSRILAPSMPQAIENAISTAVQVAFWRAHVRVRLFGPATLYLFY